MYAWTKCASISNYLIHVMLSFPGEVVVAAGVEAPFFAGEEKRAWYNLFAHARDSPGKVGN